MGLLDKIDKQIGSSRKITKNFLKTRNFYKDRWGSPADRKNSTSIFYECLVSENGIIPISDLCLPGNIIIATIKYFPEEFNGYTTYGKKWCRGNVAGKLVITYENDHVWDYDSVGGWTDVQIFDCKVHSDFKFAIDIFNIDLMKHDILPINL